ncbi:hypothetical protein OAD01_04585 [Candidatus Marinimicrobia bacterium]|jgi:hypothetical protein|nr:hypothetical protein [Candidatus Neomarinimicrobiota bacterium]|tara:strand:+ start:583 stop:885 length:303 start_codon:yes stop_codon:yes gene_type:complete
MNKESILNTDHLISFSNEEMKAYIYKLQDDLQSKLNTGLSIDDILDIEDPFEALEPILPIEVYPILVLAMINNIRSETVMDAILKGLVTGVKSYQESKRS